MLHTNPIQECALLDVKIRVGYGEEIVRAIAVLGEWAATPEWRGKSGRFTLTHLPTGLSVSTATFTARDATRIVGWLGRYQWDRANPTTLLHHLKSAPYKVLREYAETKLQEWSGRDPSTANFNKPKYQGTNDV